LEFIWSLYLCFFWHFLTLPGKHGPGWKDGSLKKRAGGYKVKVSLKNRQVTWPESRLAIICKVSASNLFKEELKSCEIAVSDESNKGKRIFWMRFSVSTHNHVHCIQDIPCSWENVEGIVLVRIYISCFSPGPFYRLNEGKQGFITFCCSILNNLNLLVEEIHICRFSCVQRELFFPRKNWSCMLQVLHSGIFLFSLCSTIGNLVAC